VGLSHGCDLWLAEGRDWVLSHRAAVLWAQAWKTL